MAAGKSIRNLPACGDCGHAAMYHLDRAVAACAVDKAPTISSKDGGLHWRMEFGKCHCMGYTAVKTYSHD